MSADGRIVVGVSGESDGNSTHEAFIWTEETGMQSLRQLLIDGGVEVGDWHLYYPEAISDDGSTIVGWGFPGYGPGWDGWIVHLPEPSTGLLFAIGLMGVARAGTRRPMLS